MTQAEAIVAAIISQRRGCAAYNVPGEVPDWAIRVLAVAQLIQPSCMLGRLEGGRQWV